MLSYDPMSYEKHLLIHFYMNLNFYLIPKFKLSPFNSVNLFYDKLAD